MVRGLIVGFVIYLVSSVSVHAAIEAAFEAPESGAVSGIGIIRGWAFENGGNIASVELYIDDVRVGNIPCCSERGDVAKSFGLETLNSGWGLTFNWGNVPAGDHTIHVVIRSTSETVWISDKRQIRVVVPAGFEFLSECDISEATVYRDGQDIVIRDAIVVDKVTGRRQKVDLRYRWDRALQNPMIIASQSSSVLTFELNVDSEDVDLIQTAALETERVFQEMTGSVPTPVHIVADTNLDLLVDRYLRETGSPAPRESVQQGFQTFGGTATTSSFYIYVGSHQWSKPFEARVQFVAHDLNHAFQDARWKRNPADGATIAAWLRDGLVNISAMRVTENLTNGAFDYHGTIEYTRRIARASGKDLRSIETYAEYESCEISYELGISAADILLRDNTSAMIQFLDRIGNGMGWRRAFEETWSPIEDFYARYHFLLG